MREFVQEIKAFINDTPALMVGFLLFLIIWLIVTVFTYLLPVTLIFVGCYVVGVVLKKLASK